MYMVYPAFVHSVSYGGTELLVVYEGTDVCALRWRRRVPFQVL